MIKYEDIKKANEQIKTTTITRYDKKTGETTSKEYAEVNQRIKAFKIVYPQGFIKTEMIRCENGVCIFKAEVGYYEDDALYTLLGTGHAYEKEGSSFINQTSYIENCETSAVGRALGMAGFGIDTSVASYEEVENAINNQLIDESKKKIIIQMAEKFEKNISDICKAYKIDRLDDMTSAQYADCLIQFKKLEDKK